MTNYDCRHAQTGVAPMKSIRIETTQNSEFRIKSGDRQRIPIASETLASL